MVQKYVICSGMLSSKLISQKVFVSPQPFCKHKKLTLFLTLLLGFNEIEGADF
jgi:hypothetical protein